MSKKQNVDNYDEADQFLDSTMQSQLPDDGQPNLMPIKQGRNDDEDEEALDDSQEESDAGEETSSDDEAMAKAKAKVKSKKAVEEEDEEEGEQVEEEQEPVEEEETPPVAKGKSLPPSEIKIIAQSKLIKEQKAQLAAYREKEQKEKEAAQVSELTQKYRDRGYDDDVAADQAQKDVRLNRLEERQAVMDFKEEHEEALRRYPQARANIPDIMQKCKAAGLDPEVYIKVLYGSTEVESDKRAKDSIRNPAEGKSSDYQVANASRSGQKADIGVGLSPADRAAKAAFEESFREGKPMTNKEWIDRKKKYPGL